MVKRIFNYISSLLVQILLFVLRSLPRRTMFHFAKYIGRAMWYILPERAKIARESIVYHLNYSYDDAQRLAKENFIQNIISFSELAYVKAYTEEFFNEHVHIVNPDILENIRNLSKDRPIIFTTGHLGSWELLPAVLSTIFNKKACIISRTTKNTYFDTVVRNARTYPNIVELSHRNSVRKIIKLLKEGYLLGLLVDHNTLRKEAVFIPFFKEKASVTIGPAFLINKTNALCVPVVLVRNAFMLELHVKEPLDPNTLPVENREYAIAALYTKSMEEFIQQYPEQWFWMHKRWKTKEKE
ncbi:MAG: lysophospholipid acyltransferase family protein [Desulfovibrionaceae bacterium]